jgi:hypothetical protein
MQDHAHGRVLGIAVAVLLLALPASAQIQDALSAYTGVNAEGYMQPLVDAFGADLNDAFFYSAYIPSSGAKFSFELALMSVLFKDEDKTFQARTEGGFDPPTTFTAPTIAGSGESVTVSGTGGTQFTAPGGFDLESFAIAVPQLRIGAFKGTEALIRFFAADIGDNEVGEIDLFGLGVRHSLTQYFDAPVDLALGAMWQSFSLGSDFVESNAFTIGVQGSKRFALLEPYGGLSWDRFKMDMTFQSDVSGSSETTKVEFDPTNTVRLTLGLGLNYKIGHAFAEYNVASTNSFAFGLTVGN